MYVELDSSSDEIAWRAGRKEDSLSCCPSPGSFVNLTYTLKGRRPANAGFEHLYRSMGY